MSSHHFVKDGQEPALIIGNGAECSYSLLKQLMEWCPFIVALDGAYQRLLELQIKPDLVIGDFDSIGEYKEDPDTTYLKIDDQETTDLEKGINYLISNDFTDINLVWVTGRRLDHTINNISILCMYPESKIVVYDDNSRAFLLPKHYEKHYPKGDTLSLIPLGKVQSITTENLEFSLQSEDLEIGIRHGSSNKVKNSGLVKINHSFGNLLLIESYNETK